MAVVHDTMLSTLVGQLGQGPHILGESLSAADVLWGTALSWTTRFKLVPPLDVVTGYIARMEARAATARVAAIDAELSAGRAAPA